MGLTSILDHGHAAIASEPHDRIEVHCSSVQVHGYHAAGPGPQRGLDVSGSDKRGLPVDVDEPCLGARQRDRLSGADERVGGDKHFVAGSNSQRAQRERQRLGAR